MKKTPDILYVGFLLGHGGDALQMMELASGMMRRGRNVKIIVPKLPTSIEFAETCRKRGIPVDRSDLIRADVTGARQSLLNLIRFFGTNRAPILHFHTGDVCLPRTVVIAMGLLRLPPAFVTIQSPYSHLSPSRLRARSGAAAVARRFQQVICPSRHSREFQLSYGVPKERVQTINNSVDLSRFSFGDPDIVRNSLNLSAETPLIVFTSRLDHQKRPLEAIKAFKSIAARIPDVHFAIVGSGTLEGECRAAVAEANLEDRVHFAGYQTNVQDWLAAATVWYLPTESENFSLAVLEALAAGCAVVSTNCPGNDEVLVDGDNSLLTEVGDVDAQAAALYSLLTDDNLRSKLKHAARAVAQNYSADRMVEAYAQCYRDQKSV